MTNLLDRSPRDRTGWTRALALTVASVALLGLTGCGDGDGDSEKETGVASVSRSGDAQNPREAGKRSVSPSDPDAGRPQLRLDTSPEEENRLEQIYFTCLRDEGVPMTRTAEGTLMPDKTRMSDSNSFAAEYGACRSKAPLPPPEFDAEKNPDWDEGFRKWLTCMNERGLKVKALPDGRGFTFLPMKVVPPDVQKIQDECQKKGFSQ
ncbi:hypothetical protein [Streptomyces sp. NPDC093598]|uniref:hypothetical protein n=1 Tax=Streptomyces sp. NPDC093598 TaxID=3366046 RepID=UPI00381A6292